MRRWHEDRAATRDLVEQIMALDESCRQLPARQRPGPQHDPAQMVGLAFLNVSVTARRRPS